MRYFAIATCLALAACGPVDTPSSTPVATPTPQASLIAAESMYACEVAYNVAASAYIAVRDNHAATNAQLAAVQPKLVTMKSYLDKARAAYAIGDAVGFENASVMLGTLKGQVLSALPTKGT